MKIIRFKPQTTINCHIWDGEQWNKEQRQAMVFDQSEFPDHKFFITFSDTYDHGYRLTEFSTGMTIGGYYAEATANKAAKWFQERICGKGITAIIEAINSNIASHGHIN